MRELLTQPPTESHFARLRRHPVVRNALSLYMVQFAEYLLPMLTVPYLSRVLGPGPWGVVIYAQSFAGWLGLLLEYGFNLSATRRLARLGGGADQAQARAEVLEEVFGASLLLIFFGLLAAGVCAFAVPLFRDRPDVLLLGAAIAIATGVRPFWYFQGLEILGPISRLNLAGRVFTTGGVFLLIHSPADANLVLWLQLASSLVILFWSVALMYRREIFRRPNRRSAWAGLRQGWSLFVTRSAISLYTVANTFVLGWFVPPSEVTMFGGPERLNRAALAVLNPLLGALYPRIANLAAGDQRQAARAAARAFQMIGGLGLAVGIGLMVFAPLLIRLLGPGYEPAVDVFRVLSLLAPLIAVNSMLGAQWMIPLGMERAVNRVILFAGALNILLAVLLAHRYGAIGMAWCAVTAEAIVLGGLFLMLLRSGKGFWSKTLDGPEA